MRMRFGSVSLGAQCFRVNVLTPDETLQAEMVEQDATRQHVTSDWDAPRTERADVVLALRHFEIYEPR